ncbi:MAG: AMP-binding protein, partial [Flavobacteriaceae bacterium]|nr:AMP-binding protein [Muriicola sp.]NNL38263.1 AMP-binding protein [Flavobacteriaceae bacterium]
MSNYSIKNLEEYFQLYRKSVREPENFWEEIAEEHFFWRKRWTNVMQWDFSKPEVKWFEGAKLNITENCLDRHLPARGDKTAIIFEPNDPGEEAQHISYNELHARVCQFANVLKSQGVSKGDRVCIYLPMIPELAIAVLACARIGAIHSVVFAGFSSQALAARINDCDCKLVITADGSFRGAKTLNLKEIVDQGLESCKGVKTVLVVKRTGGKIKMKDGRDQWIEPLLDKASEDCKAEIMDAEDPLFILYTSGSTGKPKGMVHSSAGYMVFTAYTFKNIFRYRENDIYWCTADIGWITGHSYIVYGPLANGATTVIFEGVPT